MQRFMISLLLFGLLALPAIAQDVDGPEANLTGDCVTDYDPDTDYFPEKTTVSEAENFSVTYFNHYKIVSVTGSTDTYDYVLVQCGTPTPEADSVPDGARFIEVPAGDAISLSTTFLPGFAQLGLADQIVGLDNLLYTSTPEIMARIEAGEIIEVSPGFEMNVELVLEAAPTLVMTDDFDPGRLEQLDAAGVLAAVNTDYLEDTPLGRAEWIKYTALFYNQEAAAETVYNEIVTAYEEARQLAATVPEADRPTVLWNGPFQGEWAIPGGQTSAGRLLNDAGANMALSDPDDPGVQIYSIEAVYEQALDADHWLINLFMVNTVDDLLAQDTRFADFEAVQNGDVWNNNADENENFGNNYFELGITNPHLILQDLVAIFHPDLLPDHDFNFFRPLDG